MSSIAGHYQSRPYGRQAIDVTYTGSRQLSIQLVSNQATEFIDVTDELAAFVAHSRVRTGLVTVQSLHTTMAVVVNEHEPLLLADFARQLEKMAPPDDQYAHDDPLIRRVNLTPFERTNGHSHCRALLLAASACLGIVDGRLLLGRWQRVFAVELDGPRERTIAAVVVGSE